MYSPNRFVVESPDEIQRFLNKYSFGQLISTSDKALTSTHLPFLFDIKNGIGFSHLAKANPQWKALEKQPVLITIEGAHGYVSPSWYQSPGVPTWNYQAVHVKASCDVIHDSDEIEAILQLLINQYESDTDAIEYDDRMINAIVALKFNILDIECKFKLSQNRPIQDQIQVIKKLRENGEDTLANEMALALSINE